MKHNSHQIVPPEVLKQLTSRSDIKGLIQLSAHVVLILITGSAISLSKNSAWFLPVLLLHGVVLTFIFSPLHESIHYTAFRRRWLNNAVAALSGFILFIPFQYFRVYHYAHHRCTQNEEKDPELIGKKPFTPSSYLWHLSGMPFWKSNLVSIWNHARAVFVEPYLEQRSHAKIVIEARIHLALYLLLIMLSLINSNSWILWYWLIPALLGQPFLRLFLMAEHSDCDFSDNMLENSRTTYTSPIINFLTWNMPYHAEHHYLASVPFHALPALHAYTGQSVKHRGDGYWRVLKEVTAGFLNRK